MDIKVEHNDMIKLERVFYEYTTIRDNIAFLIASQYGNDGISNNNQFDEYHKKEVDTYREYNNVKNYITLKYIPSEILAENKYKWTADFVDDKIVVTEI